MPLGHALMILMEHLMEPVTMHYMQPFHGINRLNNGHNGRICQREILNKLFGGYSEVCYFGQDGLNSFMYYAHRFGVQPLIVDGEVVTKPEYLIMYPLLSDFGLCSCYSTYSI